MRYRALSATGDYVLGAAFLANSPACVAQAIATRLKLWQGQWFVDITDGTPWSQKILGITPSGAQDAAIKQRILGTPGVISLSNYSSVFSAGPRTWTVSCGVLTQFGSIGIVVPNIVVPPTRPLIATDSGLFINTDSGLTITTSS